MMGSVFRPALPGLLAAACWMMCGSAVAADREPASINYAYANYLGSGYYLVDNQEVAILNLPFSRDRDSDGPYASRWRLPVSIGTYSFQFDPGEVEDTRLPSDVSSMTFVPGIEWTIPLSDRWHLEPYVDLGLGTNFTTHQEKLIYSVGVTSVYQLLEGRPHQWINRLLYAGDYSFTSKSVNDFASFQTGVDWRVLDNLHWRQRNNYFTTYAMAFWHFNSVKLSTSEFNAVTLRNSFEVGITWGAEELPDSRWFDITRFGIGYRFGDDLESWRIFFSKPI